MEKKDKEDIEKNYENLIDNCFFIFFQYHIHLYTGVLIFIVQSLFEFGMLILFALMAYFQNSWTNTMQSSRSIKELIFYDSGVKEE